LFVAAGLLVAVGVAGALLPRMVSSSFGTGVVVRAVNGAIRGQVEVGGLSTSWGGPTRLVGVRLMDEDGRVVLETKRAQWSAGLWQAIRSPRQFREIVAVEPDVIFYVNEAGEISLAKALELREPRPRPLTPEPVEIDRIAVQDGRLHIVRPGRPAVEFHAVATDAAIRTLSDLGGQFTFRMPEGQAVRGEFSFQNLLDDRGEIQLARATIIGRVQSDSPVDVRVIAAALAPEMRVEGTLSFDVHADVREGRGAVSFALTGRQVAWADRSTGILPVSRMGVPPMPDEPDSQDAENENSLSPEPPEHGQDARETHGRDARATGGTPAPRYAPMDVTVQGQWNVLPDAIDGSLRLAVGDQAAGVTLHGRVPLTAVADLPSLGDYFACAMIEGQDVALPPFEITGSGFANLAPLSRLFDGSLPLHEELELRGGRVEVHEFTVRGGAEPTLTAEATVTALRGRRGGEWVSLPDSSLTLDATVRVGQGLAVCGEVSAGELFSAAGQGDMEHFDAHVRADLDAMVTSVRQFVVLPPFALHGAVEGTLTVARAGDAWRVSPDVAVSGMQFVAVDHLPDRDHAARPANVRLVGTADISSRQAAGRFDLRGDVGHIDGEFRLPWSEDWQWSRNWLAAALAGERVAMPDAEFRGEIDVDLARVEEAVPGLLGTRRGFQLTTGALRISPLRLTGGGRPSAAGRISWSVLGMRDGHEICLQPLEADVAVALSAGEGLHIDRVHIDGPGVTIRASGSPGGKLSADFRIDVEGILDELTQLIDVSHDFAGGVAGTLTLEPHGRDVRVSLRADASDVRIPTGAQRQLRFARGRIEHEGIATLDDGHVTRYDARRTETAVDGVEFFVAGWVDFESGALSGTLRVPRADLAGVGAMAKELGLPPSLADGVTGTAQVDWRIRRDAAEEAVLSDGKMIFTDVTITRNETRRDAPRGAGAPREVPVPRVELAFEAVRVRPGWREIRAEMVRLTSDVATLDAGECLLTIDDAGTAAFSAKPSVRANLAASRALAAALTGNENLPALAGRLDAIGNLATRGRNVRADWVATIDDFTLGAGDNALTEKHATISGAIAYDAANNELSLHPVAAEFPSLVRAKATGTIRELSSRVILDVAVMYDGDWARTVELLHQFVPPIRQTVRVAGPTGGEFRIQGPLRDRRWALIGPRRWSFMDLHADPVFQFRTGQFYGVDLSRGDLKPTFDRGKIILPMTRIPGLAGGAVNLGGELDLTTRPPVLRIPGTVTLLDHFPINQAIGEELLSRVNPILGHANTLEGTVTLVTTDLVLPLGRDILKSGSGRGRLDLSDIEVTPKGFLGDLLRIAGLNMRRGSLILRPDGVDFTIRDGRIHYDDFRIATGALDLVFRGSVGFDDSVEMWVSMPLSRQLLGLFETGLPTDSLLRAAGNIRVEIPIRGTRLAPTLDLGALNPLPLLGGGARLLTDNPITRGVKGLFGRSEQNTPTTRPAASPEERR